MFDYPLILSRAGVPAMRIDECMAWAFGVDWAQISISMIDDRWNVRHGDLFTLRSIDYIDEALYRVGEAFMSQQTG